ncbi:MAG: hypothetical protein AAFP84_15735 [Actinomycetota bacterium]
MRVLVATRELQGTADGDYCWTVEGELVIADVVECASPDRCGCGRGFPGVASHRATTTAMVADLPHIGPSELRDALTDHAERAWSDLLVAAVDDAEPDPDRAVTEQLATIVDEYVDSIELVCRTFDVGTVIERNGSTITARSYPAAA